MHLLFRRHILVEEAGIAAEFLSAVTRTAQSIKQGKHTIKALESGTPRLRMAASLNKRKHREKHGRIMLEGWRHIREAFMAKAKVLNIFYSNPALLDHIDTSSLPSSCLAQISEETMESLSSAVTPPGIIGMFKRPRQGEGGELKNRNTLQLPLTVLCDGLKDPTNLGTLVRTSAAAACQSFITSTGCVDVWDPKVLRCAAGGHFYLPIHYNLDWEEIEAVIADKRIFLADNNISDDLCIPSSAHFLVDWTQGPSVLVIGGETTGLGEIIKNIAWQHQGQLVRVPMANTIDCLSAAMAGTVIIYEAYRQLLIAEQDR
ncbi:rRNA methyltransferase 3, mitochondrial-like isoform X1 [Stylophora pistillata]|uniref:RNA methyltransferase-like protein 1 n=2 Tax=Stylophora pistillata TaxID=50429 RepID=A0A2B4SDH8_STYPI|nr:rRNA methyltransferase 3, mitochondrial-like isoform X1 [Stylophora pistillata]PFX27416.1 RNA methyltransferase-like protein 1 [Stylophora pistillata]